MRIHRVQIKNFRSYVHFDLQVDGASLTIVAPNAGGKTTLLTAIGAVLSGRRSFGRRDFRDPTIPLELIVTLSGLDSDDQSAFVDAVQFGGPVPTMELGIRAIWDDDAEQVDVTWGFPQRDWKRVGRDARARLFFIWLPADRETERLVAFAGSRSLLERLLDSLNLDQPLEAASEAVGIAIRNLISDPVMSQLLGTLDNDLGALIPDVFPGAYDIEAAAATPRELLDQLELTLSHMGPHVAVARQSSGLGQLTVFAIALQLSALQPCIMLVDEPEMSLHPQAQRAATSAMLRHADQAIVATHSSSVLSRVDARSVVRLTHGPSGVESKRPMALTADEASTLARYATPETAEAFFARTVIFVEGASDYLALHAAAEILGVDIDARGVAVLTLQGAGLLGTYLSLLGPTGLDLDLRGLCDLDAEIEWRARLTAAGIVVTDRTTMNARGFFVCDVDLEDEIVRAHGDTAAEAIIAQHGATARFAAFASQPANRALSRTEQLTGFARRSKTRWAPRLVAALSSAAMPTPIKEVLANV